MKRNISELMAHMPAEDIKMPCEAPLSSRRIKELTMEKIKEKAPGRRIGFKILVAAAVMSILATSVMAVAGSRFADWIRGGARADRYDLPLYKWEQTEGCWDLALTAQDVTKGGMILVCEEIQDTQVTGSLTMHGGYWLEYWNGEKFVTLDKKSADPDEESREIQDGDRLEITIDWTDIYDSLEPGRYRLYKTFTYVFSDGKTVQLQDWAEFRIFNEEMAPYVKKVKTAVEALYGQQHSHISWTINEYDGNAAYAFELWKARDNYLLSIESREHWRPWGQLLRDGEAFDIMGWTGKAVHSGVTKWEYNELLTEDLNLFDDWLIWYSVPDTNVGEVWAEGNQIGLISAYYPDAEDGNAQFVEVVYTFDCQGNLMGAVSRRLPSLYCTEEEKWITSELKVYNTSSVEISLMIVNQNVGIPGRFSWAEEKKAKDDAWTVKTTGFKNTTVQEIENGYDAFIMALEEYEALAYHSSAVSYDEAEDMWKVEFWWENGNVITVIYLDGNGITRMIITDTYK